MSTWRGRYKVTWDEHDYPEIVTNARDIAAAENSSGKDVVSKMTALESTWRTLHHAMLRLGIEGVPTDYEAWLERLDDVENLEKDTNTATINGNGAAPAGEGELVAVGPDPTPPPTPEAG